MKKDTDQFIWCLSLFFISVDFSDIGMNFSGHGFVNDFFNIPFFYFYNLK